ncbi:MAG: diguanylate cyclase, partial [Burkholderiales bacterium]|nr:diguanylate cyclase [Burkholderiales bacterium]
PGATVARVGGDEFAVLLTDFREGAGEEAFPSGRELAQACQRFATRVAKAITEPLRMEGRELTMTAGIGIASASVAYPSADAMLQAARRAAVRARAEGAGNVRTAES